MKIPDFLLIDRIFQDKDKDRYYPAVINYSLFLNKISLKSLFLLILRKVVNKITFGKNRYPLELAGYAGGLKIYHKLDLNGEGYNLFFDYVRAYNQAIKNPVETILEVGAGPSYIGFLFLGLGFCKKLILTDINPEAIKVINETIKRNNLENVKVYEGDALSSIPNSCCDLIVSNPVHFNEKIIKKEWRVNTTTNLIASDIDWDFQKKVFKDAPRVLKKGGHVFLQNNYFGGDNKDLFSKFAKNEGGVVETIVEANPLTPESPMYYMAIRFND